MIKKGNVEESSKRSYKTPHFGLDFCFSVLILGHYKPVWSFDVIKPIMKILRKVRLFTGQC